MLNDDFFCTQLGIDLDGGEAVSRPQKLLRAFQNTGLTWVALPETQ